MTMNRNISEHATTDAGVTVGTLPAPAVDTPPVVPDAPPAAPPGDAPAPRAVVTDARYACTLTARGLKMASDPQRAAGAAVLLNPQEARVLIREKLATTSVTVPGAPGIPVASAPTSHGCHLAFTAATTGGAAVSRYEAISTPGNIVTQAVGAVTEIDVVGLALATEYTFRVRAVNGLGAGPYSAASNAVTTGTLP